MKFSIFATAGLLATTTALPNLFVRDNAYNSSLTTIIGDYAVLGSKVKAFEPTSLNTLKEFYAIQDSSNQLKSDLQAATQLASSGQLSLFDSIALLATRVVWDLGLISYAFIMVAAKPYFDAVLGVVSIRKTILAIIQEQDALNKQVDQKLVSIMNSFIAPLMSTLALAEGTIFDGMELVYSVPSSNPELPAGELPEPPAAASGVV